MDHTYKDCYTCGITQKGYNRNTHQKLSTFDWLSDLPESMKDTDYVEVQFKNTRKEYFRNDNQISLKIGDTVAVEASPGHDIGEVTLTGRLVLLQMKKNNIDPERYDIKRIFRIARETDIERYNKAKAKEQDTMIKARQISENMKLEMKIGDVEYQGDGNKAIFYYIADGRVDFRQLIKELASTFKVRIEMKQIGARQEAGRIGGIGPCGRELCCSSWMSNFCSVSTSSARIQDISMNPQKLAGQCGKLKCCLNYELDVYVDAIKNLPAKEIALETLDNTFYHFKTDPFKGEISYSTEKTFAANLVTISAERAKEIIALNKKGIKPDHLKTKTEKSQTIDYSNVIGEDSITRFDSKRKKRRSKRRRNPNRKNANRRRNATKN